MFIRKEAGFHYSLPAPPPLPAAPARPQCGLTELPLRSAMLQCPHMNNAELRELCEPRLGSGPNQARVWHPFWSRFFRGPMCTGRGSSTLRNFKTLCGAYVAASTRAALTYEHISGPNWLSGYITSLSGPTDPQNWCSWCKRTGRERRCGAVWVGGWKEGGVVA